MLHKLFFSIEICLIVLLSIQQGRAQKDVLNRDVDKRVEAQKEAKRKAQEEKDKPKKTEKKEESSVDNSPEKGRTIFDFGDPITEDPTIYFTGASNSKEDEIKLPDVSRVIDTADFKLRMVSVKKRENETYKKGISEKYPLIHTNLYTKKHTLLNDFKTFGWHPYWMKDAYKSYNFSLLSVIAYFAYELNPNNGNYTSIHDWETTELIPLAQKAQCKVLLSVWSAGKEKNEKFLANRTAQRNLVNTLIELLKKRKANGVHLDFEDIPLKRKEEFTDFVLDLTSQIKGAIPSSVVTLTLPAIDFDRVYDISKLNDAIDLFTISGFEFYGMNNKIAGPIAPIKGVGLWWQWALEQSIDDYLAAGLKPKKLLLGVPYYGAEWATEKLQFPSVMKDKKSFLGYPMYRDVIKLNRPHINEPISMSSYIPYRDSRDNNRQVWFDDSLSLSQKYSWVMEKKIGGVAIWALGYDNGRIELWQALAAKFAIKPKQVKNTKMTLSWFTRLMNTITRVANNPMVLLRNPSSLTSILVLLFGSSMIGFGVLLRFGCRFSRTFNLAMKGGISVILLVALAIIIIVTTNYNSWYLTATTFLLGGFIIGAIAFLFLSRSFLVEKDLP